MDRELKVKISEICSLLDVDGIRGDITTNKAARALAAYRGETTVTLEHIQAVIGLCLNHRYVPPHPCLLLCSQHLSAAPSRDTSGAIPSLHNSVQRGFCWTPGNCLSLEQNAEIKALSR